MRSRARRWDSSRKRRRRPGCRTAATISEGRARSALQVSGWSEATCGACGRACVHRQLPSLSAQEQEAGASPILPILPIRSTLQLTVTSSVGVPHPFGTACNAPRRLMSESYDFTPAAMQPTAHTPHSKKTTLLISPCMLLHTPDCTTPFVRVDCQCMIARQRERYNLPRSSCNSRHIIYGRASSTNFPR